MRRYRGPLVVVGSVAIAAAVLAAPVAAADPRLALAKGIPGRKVDVCIGNNEVRSNLKSGGWDERFVGPGSRIVRFRAAAPGKCKGTVLAQRTLLLAEDDDKTVVGTRRAPKAVVFENLPYPAVTDGISRFRYAADLGPVNVHREGYPGFTEPAAPTPAIAKGQQTKPYAYPGSIALQYIVFLAGDSRPFHGDFYTWCLLVSMRVEARLHGHRTQVPLASTGGHVAIASGYDRRFALLGLTPGAYCPPCNGSRASTIRMPGAGSRRKPTCRRSS